jgi:hypothetical protein
MMQNQRWEEGRVRWRPAGEVIRTSDYEVGEISRAAAEGFVARHHYAKTSPAGRFWYGLHRHGQLVGVSIFSQPCNNRTITKVFPFDFREGVDLGRLVLLDEVPGNGESWFVSQCFSGLRKKDILGAVAFSDPVRRVAADGRVILPGHKGTVYQALSAVYLGRADGRTLRIFHDDGTSFNHRTEQKISGLEQGYDGAVAQLVVHGAERPARGEDLDAWRRIWIGRLTYPLKHRGNHKYAFSLNRKIRKHLPDSLPYPKTIDGEAA